MYSNSFLQLSDFPHYARQILYESISIQYLLLSSVSDPVFFRIRNTAFKYKKEPWWPKRFYSSVYCENRRVLCVSSLPELFLFLCLFSRCKNRVAPTPRSITCNFIAQLRQCVIGWVDFSVHLERCFECQVSTFGTID